MEKIFNITVDIGRKLPAPAFEVNTNDLKSVKLIITITNGQTLLNLTDTTVRIAIRKPDSHIIFQDCTVKDATSGQVEIILENQAYIMPGTHTAEIMCYKGSEVVAVSGTFSYKSTKGIMNDEAVESKSEFTTISNMMKDVQDTIDDIRKNGTGVDAKARQDIQSVATQLAESATKTELETEKARINNLVANAGDTDGNAELLDIRVDSEGNTFSTAGELVRKIDKRTIDVIEREDDAFYIVDNNGNIIFKATADGVEGVGFSSVSNSSPFKGLKLITIGDSLSAHDKYQKWLVEWAGVVFDLDENINGKNGHAPMAVGGTGVAPTSNNSIYIRSLDAKHYKPDLIIVYAGQNDAYVGNTETGVIDIDKLGAINNTPYLNRVVTTTTPTFYASYMGMVENLITDNPNARIYLMTHMPVRLEIGMVGTESPWNGIVRFETEADAQLYENVRYAKVKAIREIAEKYNLPLIDLWRDAGINHFNSRYWYGEVGGGAGQVHPNDLGYKRMAEVINSKL